MQQQKSVTVRDAVSDMHLESPIVIGTNSSTTDFVFSWLKVLIPWKTELGTKAVVMFLSSLLCNLT
jgi:hypothetical protein